MLEKNHTQHGFSLIELIVVVGILAAMAGIAVSVVGGYDTEAREQLVHVEMKTITEAIYRFKNDTGYFPKTGTFSGDTSSSESLDFLFNSPDVDGVAGEDMPWNITAGRGWHGPYLSQDSEQRLHIPYGTASESDCDISIVSVANSVAGLEDPFEKKREGSYTNKDSCFVIFDGGNWVTKNYAGQAYQYVTDFSDVNYPKCTAPETCIVLRSAGPDGDFLTTADNIIKILNVN